MRHRMLPAALILICLATAGLTEPKIPEDPHLRDFPKGPRGSLALYTTTVARGSDGTDHVMKGFIWGKLNGTSSYIVHNPETGLQCDGTTKRVSDRSGQGVMTCRIGGQTLGTMPFTVPAGKYGKFKGSTTGPLLDAKGKKIGVFMTRWSSGAFPDPAEMLAAF